MVGLTPTDPGEKAVCVCACVCYKLWCLQSSLQERQILQGRNSSCIACLFVNLLVLSFSYSMIYTQALFLKELNLHPGKFKRNIFSDVSHNWLRILTVHFTSFKRAQSSLFEYRRINYVVKYSRKYFNNYENLIINSFHSYLYNSFSYS